MKSWISTAVDGLGGISLLVEYIFLALGCLASFLAFGSMSMYVPIGLSSSLIGSSINSALFYLPAAALVLNTNLLLGHRQYWCLRYLALLAGVCFLFLIFLSF